LLFNDFLVTSDNRHILTIDENFSSKSISFFYLKSSTTNFSVFLPWSNFTNYSKICARISSPLTLFCTTCLFSHAT